MNNRELIKYFGVNENELENFTKFKITQGNNFLSKKQFFEERFGEGKMSFVIPDESFLRVVSGEGNEDRKITTFYSSSLQSLLFFAGVSKTNPIVFNGVEYTRALFEWRNPVLNKPSSIDVVLLGNLDTDHPTILFIESKLYEIIRDSTTTGRCVIGRSYFDNPNGYGKLGLNEKDYPVLGIEKNGEGKGIVNPVGSGKYVYSYGIKQALSHIIGILNFREKNAFAIGTDYDIRFLTLINEMPGFTGNSDPVEKTTCFCNHYNTVIALLRKKEPFQENKKPRIYLDDCISYQKFFQEMQESEKTGKKYQIPPKIINYYYLESKI